MESTPLDVLNPTDSITGTDEEVLDSVVDYYRQSRDWVRRARVIHGANANDRRNCELVIEASHKLPPTQPAEPEVEPDSKEPDSEQREKGNSGNATSGIQQVPHEEWRLFILNQYDSLISARLDVCDRIRRMVGGNTTGDIVEEDRYAPLPNPRTDEDAQNEMEAAFDDSEDEDERSAESRPLNPTAQPSTTPPSDHQPPEPVAYDFENVDYDYPPPGSPPKPSAWALPNSHGNTNGFVPPLDLNTSATPKRRGGWFRRTAAAILPSHYVQRLGLAPRVPTGAIGGGSANDGVFANVTAKPSRSVRVVEGDNAYMVPEDTRQEAPPSYASAQADAVPPYWETTVHAPFSSDAPGEMIIENLPTGSLFSFLWNMLVTISFQLVGFLLTYLLHTTHAARLGSRSGLGVILIQYGFALRGRSAEAGNDDSPPEEVWRGWGASPAEPTTRDDYLHGNATVTSYSNEQVNAMVIDVTRQWLSFFLMTVGWFLLLTSLLNFWRIKRWERGILASQRENATAVPATASAGSQIHQLFGFHNALFLRQGLGLSSLAWPGERAADPGDHDEENPVPQFDPDDPELSRRAQEVWQNEVRLRHELRAAGLI